MGEKNVSLGQESHAPRGALEKGRSELVLEGANLPTHRRLGDVQPFCGAPHVAFLGHGNEVSNL